MRPHDLDALEYHRVLERLASFAQSESGAAACRRLRPLTAPAAVAVALEQTWQVLRLRQAETSTASTAVPDIAAHLKTACHEGFVLDGMRLVEVRKVLTAGRELGAFLRRHRERVPALASLIERLVPPRELEKVLLRALDDEGVVRDEASDELAAVRAAMRDIRAKLTRRLETLVQRHTMADVVAEEYVTLRNNRFVIPVKSNYGQKMQGIVQDRSSSGETLFLEPLFAVEMNNSLLLQAREEERIVRRILADLTDLVRQQADSVGATFEAVTEFDVLAAKAAFAERFRCTQPQLSEGEIDLRRARHPILLFNERTVVPVDIHLPHDKVALVITGPNTGGKTVALKTVGLLSLMAQSGLMIPAEEGSRLPCWAGVFADVGDEQNIQRNLSTFSAHIANLVDLERSLEPPALVLLDEPGVGTDPEEGAALAIGLLETLPSRASGVRVIATTHYTPVKLFALTQEHCVVAAVDFDLPTLVPKYRLLYHSLGESLALPIAEQLGLAPRVLAAARGALSEQTRTVQAALAKLEETRRGYEGRREEVVAREQAIDARERESTALLDELQARRREKWRGELETARQFVRDLKAEGRAILAQLRAAERDFRAAPHRGAEAGASRVFESFVDRALAAIESSAAESAGDVPIAVEPVRVGDQVEIAGGGFRGELVSVSGERAWIRRGTMRVEVPAAQLRRAAAEALPRGQRAREGALPGAGTGGQPSASPVPSYALSSTREEGASPEVTLIGMRAREALAKLEEALDRAALAGLASVRVVHGKGSGALRRAVQEYLHLSPYCARFRDGANEEGGTGVTIVELGS